MQQLPGVPPIVLDAQKVVAQHNGHLLKTFGASGLLGALLFGAAIVTGVEPLLGAALLAFLATLFVGMTRRTVSDAQLRDAHAVLKQWDAQREDWAKQLIDESLQTAGDEVRAYNEAVPKLRAMQAEKKVL